MIAKHTIKINGKWYKAGEEISLANTIVHDPVSYSKTEINRMPIAELRRLAERKGISDFDKKTGAELKKNLINSFNL